MISKVEERGRIIDFSIIVSNRSGIEMARLC